MSVATPAQTTDTRPLPLRRRVDLECRPQQFQGSTFWHVKDPVSLRYFQLRPEEYAVLNMLDGKVSLQEIRHRFEDEFSPQTLSLSQLQSFLVMLHGSGLVLSDTSGQADVLLERMRQTRRQRHLARFTNPLAIQFRGFDPQRILDHLQPWTRFLFSPWCVTLCLGLMLTAVLLAAARWDTLAARLPYFHEFFSPVNLLWLAATMGVTKVLHELGHAVSCRHFGGECHEMGVLLLVFTPCLYCNVSDAWMLPSRWHRIVISAAGMYVELLLASACLFLWWFSVPGLFNSMCLNVVVVCSISAVLFNGNPLLRYDGYYILSDLVSVPNLRQQAATLVHDTISRWFFDRPLDDLRFLPEQKRAFLASWYVASLVYRVLVLWGILWLTHRILRPMGLEVLVVILAVFAVAGMVTGPVIRLWSLWSNYLWRQTVNWPLFRVRSLIALTVLATACLAPLPFSVRAPAVIQPDGARTVYVEYSGRLLEAVSAGETVQPGDVLARLENLDLERDVARLSADVARLERELENLETRRLTDGAAVEPLIPTTRERLLEKRDRLRQRQLDSAKLSLKAPVGGTVLPAATVAESAAQHSRDRAALDTWSGSPLDPENLGATLETGIALCHIGKADQVEAVLAIDEGDVEFVASGQSVELIIDGVAGRVLTGTVTDIAEIDLDITPRQLLEHDRFPTRRDSDGTARPATTAYQARVRLDQTDASLPLWSTGLAKISAPSQSPANRFVRFLRRTFRFRD